MNRNTDSASNTASILIVGGGVIGLSLAWELSKRGHRVTLVDRARLGRATSWAASGILPSANFETAADPMDRLRGYSHRLFPAWHQELLSLTGIDSGLRRCGGWYLATTPGERASLIGMAEYWRELQIECETVTAAQLAELEPALAVAEHTAWFTPDEYQIRCPRFLQALIAANRLAGVELIEDAPVIDVCAQYDRAEIELPTKVLTADLAILCGGAWTPSLAAKFSLQASVIPIRGQILLLRSESPLLHSVVNVGHRYLIPRPDGLTLVGSTDEEVGYNTQTTPQAIASLHQFAIEMCPGLASAEVLKSWSGLRPMTFDGFPMLGRVPGFNNLWVAAGHYRSGIHLSCATAQVVANAIEGRDNIVNLDAFAVGKQQQRTTQLAT